MTDSTDTLQALRPVHNLWRPFLLTALTLIVTGCEPPVPPSPSSVAAPPPAESAPAAASEVYAPRRPLDTAGFIRAGELAERLPASATLADIGAAWRRVGYRRIEEIDRRLADDLPVPQRVDLLLEKASMFNYEGDVESASAALQEARALLDGDREEARRSLYSVIYFQGVTALRRGENENCILCRGESSCILPLASAAIHVNPEGSRMAIGHFLEYLAQFPDDRDVQWLLNLAHMTLGEYPQGVDPRFLISLEPWRSAEPDFRRFRDVGHLVGVNRLNQAGGAVLEDFNNDGLLDVAVTTMDPAAAMALYQSAGDGRFLDVTQAARLTDQLGGLNCVQTDFNNDGWADLLIIRGAWRVQDTRLSLLRNNQDGTFTDVTAAAGVAEPVNSIAACWADYDNDGWLDLFVCCERQPNRLYRNRRDGTFEDLAEVAGVAGGDPYSCKGAAWIDFDNDDDPDLYLNHMVSHHGGRLYRNDDGKFVDVTRGLGISGPDVGFACWAFDYNNDGWLDLFAASYDRGLAATVDGLNGRPHRLASSRLFHNHEGRSFEDVARRVGLDGAYATMGCNFADFDNDGFLDLYLGTGDPQISMLVPNRLFRNVAGQRFADVTVASGTGHLQKGHGVACGDWDQDGDSDLFIEMGGAVPGDRYHNVLFQNPGGSGSWLNIRLIGRQTNRAGLGARIRVVTAGPESQTIHRHVSSGSSFGGNPFEQLIGLGDSDRVETLEVRWPTSRTTQTFHDLAVNQALEIEEFAGDFRVRTRRIVPLPAPSADAAAVGN